MLPRQKCTLKSEFHTRGLAGDLPASASPAIASGLSQLYDVLVAEGTRVNSYDELYSAAISILKMVAAKEMRQMNNKSNTEKR